MSDVLEKLENVEASSLYDKAALDEAILAITTLRAENARLREALERIACRHVGDKPLWWQEEARAALGDKP